MPGTDVKAPEQEMAMKAVTTFQANGVLSPAAIQLDPIRTSMEMRFHLLS